MSEVGSPRKSRKLFRLWSVPLLLGGVGFLTGIMGSGAPHQVLFGLGMLLGAVFAYRHDLSDLSPDGLNPAKVGIGGVALLVVSVLLMIISTVLAFFA